MKRQTPYPDSDVNSYAASQMQHMPGQRMPYNAGMNNVPSEQESQYVPLNAEGAPRASNPTMNHRYPEGQGGDAARSFYQGQIADPKVELEKQGNKDPRLQTQEQDMEIGYEDKPSTVTLEVLERKFQDEILKLVKEQSDAEDAENARHREKVIEISIQYQEKLASLRAQQTGQRDKLMRKEAQERAIRREELFRKEAQEQAIMREELLRKEAQEHANLREELLLQETHVRLQQYRRAEMAHQLTNAGPIGPHGYNDGAPMVDPRRAYATGQFDPYREQTPFLGGGRSQGTEARVPYPQGRVYNNSAGRNYQ